MQTFTVCRRRARGGHVVFGHAIAQTEAQAVADVLNGLQNGVEYRAGPAGGVETLVPREPDDPLCLALVWVPFEAPYFAIPG